MLSSEAFILHSSWRATSCVGSSPKREALHQPEAPETREFKSSPCSAMGGQASVPSELHLDLIFVGVRVYAGSLKVKGASSDALKHW